MPRDGTTADTVVVELEARLGNYQSQVNQGANAFDRSMQQIASSATAAERSTGQAFTAISGHAGNARVAQQMLMHVSRSTADQFAAGAPPMMIFSGHLAQLAEAATFAGGSMGKVGEFLSGPWGIAVTIAASVAATLAGKLMEGGNEAEKAFEKLKEHAHQADIAKDAQARFGKTIEGVTQAIREENDALEKQNRTLADNVKLARQAAMDKLRVATQDRDQVAKDLEKARRQLRSARAGLDDTGGATSGSEADAAITGNQNRYDAAKARVTQLMNQLAALNEAITEGQRNVRESTFPLAEELAKRATDRIAAINGKYDDMAKAAEKAAAGNNKLTASLAGTLAAIERQRKADLKAAQPSRGNNSLTGREVTPAEAAGIARAAGLQVNSSSRTYGQQKALYDAWVAKGMPKDNPVAVPGSSAHEGARGRWALDIQFGEGVTPELLRKVFADQGISLSKVFKERGHFHVEGSRAQADAAQVSLDRDKPKYTAAQMRDQFEIDNYDPKAPMKLFDSQDLAADFEKITGIKAATTDIAGMIATFPPLPDFSKIIPEEEQHRIDEFVLNLKEDLAGSLADAITQGKNLGDVLVNTFKRAAAALLESGILNAITGGQQGVSFAHMAASLGTLFGGKTTPLPSTPGMASGGHVTAGKLYRVNESGVEGFQPAGSGKIIPLGQMASMSSGGGGGMTVMVNVDAKDAVLADTVRGWVLQGVQEATTKGALAGRSLALGTIRRSNRGRLA